ncbi:GNAT family N-acetyltransferase [Georgenia sunbinii]|uniref:GNAT family N-acetyltransferase n=1 Tax=Georgenia sunbinii TaxID=3117728 RepID=UPI002F2609BF
MTTATPRPGHDDFGGDDVLGELAAEVGAFAGDPLVAAPVSDRAEEPDPHAGHDHGPTADVSVRPAIPEDAALVTSVQLQAWQRRGLVAAAQLAAIDTAAVRARWLEGISKPPSAQHRVLAACDGSLVVGFAAYAPAAAVELPAAGPVTDAVEILALEVVADHTRHGHGSRLLAACVDLATDAGAGTLLTWATDDDDPRTRFLHSAGFAPGGLRRELPTPGGTIVEHCWYTRV